MVVVETVMGGVVFVVVVVVVGVVLIVVVIVIVSARVWLYGQNKNTWLGARRQLAVLDARRRAWLTSGTSVAHVENVPAA